MTASTMAIFTTPQKNPTMALNTQKATRIAIRPPPAINTPSKKVSPVRSSSAMPTTIMPRSAALVRGPAGRSDRPSPVVRSGRVAA